MAVVVIGGSVAAWLCAGMLQARAAAPGASPVSILVASPGILFGRTTVRTTSSTSGARRAGPWPTPPSLTAAAGVITLGLVLPGAVLAAAFLLAAGHVPTGPARAVLLVAGVGALFGLATTASGIGRNDGRKDWLVARGLHLAVAVVAGEALILAAALGVAGTITHTGGTLVSFAEVGSAAVVARAVTLLRFPPAGLFLADATFVTILIGTGVPTAASLATVAVWRVSLGLACAVGVVGHPRTRIVRSPLALPQMPTGTRLGEWVHRTCFRAMAVLPHRARGRARSVVFEAMFSLAQDPWRHDELPYERRKSERLLERVPLDAATVVELGCADGHNLLRIACARPRSSVVGVDISAKAVTAARRRGTRVENMSVLCADARGAVAVLRAHAFEPVDVLIIAEMLYYLGGPSRVGADLTPLAPILAPGATVLLIHPLADSDALHAAAITALGCRTTHHLVVADDERPYVIEVATR